MRISFRALFLVALVFLFAPSCLRPQGTDLGTIRGTVTDASGGVVANAKVVIADLKTKTARSTTTNNDGVYGVFGLNSGAYTVTISASGFETAKITGIMVTGGAVIGADAVLRVSSKTETLEVIAEAGEIHTEDQTISQTISSQSVMDLPRDSRDVYSFLYLNPNITQGSDAGEYKFIGAQSYGANFTVDGQRSNGGIFGSQTNTQPPLDAVDEINVMSNDSSAEYAGISNIRVTSKRGGSEYHGSALYENSNSALAAWTVQDLNNKAAFEPTAFQSSYPTPYFNYNVFSGTVGGPIPKVKNTWFFLAYERDYTAKPVNMQSSSLPHPSLLAGDFSQVSDSKKPLVPADVQLTPDEIANDTLNGDGLQFIQIPQRLLNPYVTKLVDTYYPHIGMDAPYNPNGNGSVLDYGTLQSGLGVQDLGTMRLDHDFNAKNHLFGVYHASADTDDTSQFVQTPYTGLGLTNTDRRNNTVTVSFTREISTSLVNDAYGGFNKQKLFRHSNTTLGGFLSDIGFSEDQVKAYGDVVSQDQLATYGHPAINFNGVFATFNNGGRNTDRPMDQNLITFGDKLTWIRGKHSLRFGADAVRNQALDGFAVNRGNVRGLMTYKGSGTTPLADFLMGEAATTVTYVLQPRPAMDVHNWEQGYYVQDDWRITPRLTLNLGFRYEITTPFVDANDIMVNFDPNYVDPATGRKGRFIAASSKTLQYLAPSVVNYGVVTAADSGLGIGRGLIHQSWDKVAPRLGFAWSLNGKMVLRGGWGLYYPTSAAQGVRDPLATNTFNQAITKRSVVGTSVLSPWPTSSSDITSPMSDGVVNGFGNQPSASIVDMNVKDPRVQQYNFSLEREIGWSTVVRASYLGSYMGRLIAATDVDAIQPSDNPIGVTNGDGVTLCDPYNNGDCNYSTADLARIPFPELPDGIGKFSNTGHGRSNAFQAEFNHRYSSGLMFSLSYTYLDQKSTPPDSGNSSLGSVSYNLFNPSLDYGEDSYVSHHRFVAYGTYDLPFGRGKKYGAGMSTWLNAVAGNWQTVFNMFAKSGTYFTPFWICDDCDPVQPGNIATSSIDAVGDYASNSFRPSVLNGNYNHPANGAIWDSSAFGVPTVGADLFSASSVAGRNILQGPGAWGLNLGVHKQFHVGERIAILFGVDVDNLFNHPLFMPNQDYAGGGGTFAQVGDFNVLVDQTTGKLSIPVNLPASDPNAAANATYNPDFGKLLNTFSQESVASRRTIRLRLRITF
jgi:Carboxypeptidase regulatory-like domain